MMPVHCSLCRGGEAGTPGCLALASIWSFLWVHSFWIPDTMAEEQPALQWTPALICAPHLGCWGRLQSSPRLAPPQEPPIRTPTSHLGPERELGNRKEGLCAPISYLKRLN